MGIKTLLETEIQSEIEALRDCEVGTKEYESTIDGVTKLMDRKIEMDRISIEDEFRIATQVDEYNLKLREMEYERKDRIIKNALTALSIATGVGLTVWGTIKSLKFEEEGTVTTIMGRGFINKLLPKK